MRDIYTDRTVGWGDLYILTMFCFKIFIGANQISFKSQIERVLHKIMNKYLV